MVNSRTDITNNIGKAYMAVIMSLFMILLEITILLGMIYRNIPLKIYLRMIVIRNALKTIIVLDMFLIKAKILVI